MTINRRDLLASAALAMGTAAARRLAAQLSPEHGREELCLGAVRLLGRLTSGVLGLEQSHALERLRGLVPDGLDVAAQVRVEGSRLGEA